MAKSKSKGNRFSTFKKAAAVAERYATKYGRAVLIINFGTHFSIIRNWGHLKGRGGILVKGMPRRVTSAPRSKRLKVNPRGRRKNPATFPNRPLSASFKVGDRVELHPATDSWMRGDRYGDIAKVGRDFVYVKLDRSGRTKKFHPKNVNVIEHGGGSFSAGAKRNPVGTFNRSQLDRLAHHYGKIKTINPSGPGYRKLRAYLADLPQAALKQLAGERIKFLSAMARNRVAR